MSFIWATRGRNWGFRFLRRHGLGDPLPVYEAAFVKLAGEPDGVARAGDCVALRFADPEGRTDRSRRAISHDFVLFGDLARGVESVADGRERVWPLVAEDYARVWSLAIAPRPFD